MPLIRLEHCQRIDASVQSECTNHCIHINRNYVHSPPITVSTKIERITRPQTQSYLAPQVELIESGRGAEVVQETRSWDEVKQATASMRSKEGLADYRFFPEPDLSLLTITEDDIAAAAVRSYCI